MLIDGPVPDWLFSIAVATTLFAVMFDLGLAIVPGEFRWVVRRPALMAKAVFSVVIAVPAIAWIVCRALDLPRAAEIGIMLMAIAPGAPVALRRSLDAGGHRSFAPALQILVVTAAIVSMPLFIVVLNEYYAGAAGIDPLQLAQQVLVAQLLPLALGMGARKVMPERAARFEPRLHRIAGLLLLLVVVLALIDIWRPVIGAGFRVASAIVVVTLLAAAVGHVLAGPEPTTRTATAISSAARNAGLALLVVAFNEAPPQITATVLAYFVISALTLTPYAIWRARVAKGSMETTSDP
jgi:BASS family bile acid:Na+ symporter